MIEKEGIKTICKEIGSELEKEINIYVLGGVVLMKENLKPSTKDIDVVLSSTEDYKEFISSLESLGFQLKRVEGEYLKFKFSGIYENGDLRFDVFDKEVCEKLSLSEKMIKRAELWFSVKKLKVFLLSLEDVFIFKSLTEREGDIADSVALVRRGLDWKIIEEEIKDQIEKHDKQIWITYFAERFVVLKERYDIEPPISDNIHNAASEYYDLLDKKLSEKD